MAKADGGLRKVFQKYLPKPDWLWTPVETGGTQNGVPDSYYANRKERFHGWLECKKTDGWAVKFESHQLSWMERHADAGVHVWVAIRGLGVGSGGGLGDSLWLAPATAADAISLYGLNGVPRDSFYGVWFGPPKDWDWKAIAHALGH